MPERCARLRARENLSGVGTRSTGMPELAPLPAHAWPAVTPAPAASVSWRDRRAAASPQLFRGNRPTQSALGPQPPRAETAAPARWSGTAMWSAPTVRRPAAVPEPGARSRGCYPRHRPRRPPGSILELVARRPPLSGRPGAGSCLAAIDPHLDAAGARPPVGRRRLASPAPPIGPADRGPRRHDAVLGVFSSAMRAFWGARGGDPRAAQARP